MDNGKLFQLKVVVPGDSTEAAWKELHSNPAKYLPKELDSKITVFDAQCGLTAVETYGNRREPSDAELKFASHFGWYVNSKNYWVKETEEDFEDPYYAIIAWNTGWAPWATGTGVLDNASWADLRAAIRCAERVFYKNDLFIEEHAICNGCFSHVPFKEIFFHRGATYCSTGCVV